MNILPKRLNAYYNSYRIIRELSTSENLNIKITFCGCSGGVGQPFSLLLKISTLVKELALYDVSNALGVQTDLSHINTRAKTTAFTKPNDLDSAMENADIVVITAGQARKPGMTRKDLFEKNADIIRGFTTAMIRAAPRAMLCIVTNPVNSVVPVAAGILDRANCYDPRKVFGITTLDSVRTSTFLSELLCLDPTKLCVPVIGGHSGETIVPVFSQAYPPVELPKDKIKALTVRIQNAGTEVVKAKGTGSATLSMGFAGARFVISLCRAIKGESDIVEPAYVQSELTDAKFFATPLLLGPEGMKKNLGFGKLNDYECRLVDTAVKELLSDIKLADDYFKKQK